MPSVKARDHRPDVVVLDITMPVMNGFEAARRIKQELQSTRIVMVSQFDFSQVCGDSLVKYSASLS
jgi:CheY-like chemotaxis protein